MQKNQVVVDIDERPSSLDPKATWDYIGLQILSTLRRPLLYAPNIGRDDAEPAASYVEWTRTGFCLHFQTGELATLAFDYVKYYLNECKGRFRWLLLNPLTTSKLSLGLKQDKLYFSGITESLFIEHVLSCPMLSGLPGPYVLQAVRDSGGCYEAVVGLDWARLKIKNTDLLVDQITFRKYAHRDIAFSAFNRGEVNLTCNTMFSYGNIAQVISSPAFHIEPTRIFMVITKDSPPEVNARPTALTTLNSFINRAEISKVFNRGLRPATFLYPRSQTSDKATYLIDDDPPSVMGDDGFKGTLSIVYNDYFPNREILEEISKSLVDHGILCELVRDDFLNPSKRGDMRLVLVSCATLHPLEYFLPYCASVSFSKDPNTRDQYLTILEEMVKCRSASGLQALSKKATEILVKESILLPLFEVRSLYLKDESLQHHCFLPGKVWHRTNCG